MLQRVLITFHR